MLASVEHALAKGWSFSADRTSYTDFLREGEGGRTPANDDLMHFYARNICETKSPVANLI